MPPPKGVLPSSTPPDGYNAITTIETVEFERLAAWLENPGQAPLHHAFRAILRNLLYHAQKGTMVATLEQRQRLEQIVASFPLEER